jgi:hypothetical protein
MTEENKRLDESLSNDSLSKSLTGRPNVHIDVSTITVSASGNIQPAASEQHPSSESENSE